MYKRQIKTITLDRHDPKVLETLANYSRPAHTYITPQVFINKIKYSKPASPVFLFLKQAYLWATSKLWIDF